MELISLAKSIQSASVYFWKTIIQYVYLFIQSIGTHGGDMEMLLLLLQATPTVTIIVYNYMCISK